MNGRTRIATLIEDAPSEAAIMRIKTVQGVKLQYTGRGVLDAKRFVPRS